MNQFNIWNDKLVIRLNAETKAELEKASRFDQTKLNSLRRSLRKVEDLTERETILENIKKLESLEKIQIRHILPYIKYSEKMHAYTASLSVQNLVRLKKYIPDIQPKGADHALKKLKTEHQYFKSMVETAKLIKNGHYDHIEIPYKMKPIGTYQHRGVLFLCMIPSAPLFADCGLGKTYMVLTSTQQQINEGIIPRGKTLICGKLATLKNGWQQDALKFTDLKVSILWESSSYKRKEKLLKKLEEEADVYIINHEGLVVLKQELIEKNFKKIVVDESTVLKSLSTTFVTKGKEPKGGSIGRALMEIAHSADWRVIMSGTPAPNSFEDLWGQFHFLDPKGFILEAKKADFKNTYMDQITLGKGDDPKLPKKWIYKEGSSDAVSNLIRPLAFRARMKDHLKDMPSLTRIVRSLPMSNEQRTHYSEMEEYLETIINDETISVKNRLTELMKLRQITAGFIRDKDHNDHAIKGNPKLDMLDSLLRDEIALEDKVIIFAQYRWEIETIRDRYKDLGVSTVYGGNTSAESQNNISSFIHNPSTKIIILHPKSGAHGITLVVSHYMIFYSLSDSNEEYYQAVKRIERNGQKHPMFVYHLLCDESVDHDIYNTIVTKQKNQEELIDQESININLIKGWRRRHGSKK